MGKGLVKTLDDLLVKYGLISGEVPTTEELAWLKESRERVEMVIRARWAILAILAGYAVYAYFFFRHATADALHQTAVVVYGIAASHGLEYPVIARLKGEVEVLAHPVQRGHGVNDALAHVVGVRGQEAYAAQAVHLVYSA